MPSWNNVVGRLSAKAIAVWVGLPPLIMPLTWPPLNLEPGPGGDVSWGAGLQLAIHESLTFGTQAVSPMVRSAFLASPLSGFPTSPLYHLSTLW
jgi:hypothetical protein